MQEGFCGCKFWSNIVISNNFLQSIYSTYMKNCVYVNVLENEDSLNSTHMKSCVHMNVL
jgi:hypothetical protein